MKPTIWHNPRCSKSRQTLALLEARGLEPEVRLYLEEPPSAAELREVLGKLAMAPADILRAKEARELGVAADVEQMAAHPKVIQRPIVILGDRAAVGRPPEAVLALWD